MPYLDVIKLLKDNTNLPIAAYHVSGEYAMMKAAAQKGWLDEKKVSINKNEFFKCSSFFFSVLYRQINPMNIPIQYRLFWRQ